MLSVDEPGSIAAPSRVADSRNKVATCIYQQPLRTAAAGGGGGGAAAATVWRCCCCTATAAAVVVMVIKRYPGRTAALSGGSHPRRVVVVAAFAVHKHSRRAHTLTHAYTLTNTHTHKVTAHARTHTARALVTHYTHERCWCRWCCTSLRRPWTPQPRIIRPDGAVAVVVVGGAASAPPRHFGVAKNSENSTKRMPIC